MKIRPLVAQLFHADGHSDGLTDMTNFIVAFRNFAKAPKNCLILTSNSFICKLYIFKFRR